MYRQGDVLLIEIEKLPDNVKIKNNILALGEESGHYHELVGNVETYESTRGNILNGIQWVVVNESAKLEHKKKNDFTGDHNNIDIDPGIYKVNIQKEYISPEKETPRNWD
jgi:hypothetical protein